MTVGEYVSRVTPQEHEGWVRRLNERWNEPSRDDWYIMQLTAELRMFRLGFTKSPRTVQPHEARLKFPSVPDPRDAARQRWEQSQQNHRHGHEQQDATEGPDTTPEPFFPPEELGVGWPTDQAAEAWLRGNDDGWNDDYLTPPPQDDEEDLEALARQQEMSWAVALGISGPKAREREEALKKGLIIPGRKGKPPQADPTSYQEHQARRAEVEDKLRRRREAAKRRRWSS